jgi:hypothetical protein
VRGNGKGMDSELEIGEGKAANRKLFNYIK